MDGGENSSVETIFGLPGYYSVVFNVMKSILVNLGNLFAVCTLMSGAIPILI